MANKEEIQKVKSRLGRVIKSMESHLTTFKRWEKEICAGNFTVISDDIKDFEEFFETSDNSELKG